MVKKHAYIGIGAVVVLVGCAGPRPVATPGASPWAASIKSYRAAGIDGNEKAQPTIERGETITLRRSLAFALAKSPELAAVAWESRAADARTAQASLRSNPELELEVEELSADSGTDAAVVSLAMGAEIDVWGKRGKRTKAAQLASALAGWDYEAARRQVLAGTTKAFMSVLVSQERLKLAEKKQRLSRELYRIAAGRFKAGEVPKLEQTKAEVSMATATLDSERALDELENNREALSGMWGRTQPLFGETSGDMAIVLDKIPSLAQVTPYLKQSPEYARREQEIALREANVVLAKANRLPEIGASARIENSLAESETTFGVGLSFSFPVFDRSQGAIAEAECDLSKARHERHGAEVGLRLALAQTHRALSTAARHVDTLKEKALPAAREVLQSAQAGYRQGKHTLLDVLDAQGTLFETEERYIDALAEYHGAIADMQRLIGCRLDDVSPKDGYVKERAVE